MRSKQGAHALKILGINAHDASGHLKDSGKMLDEVADKMSKMKDSTEKTALAGALFGQGYGIKLIPMLNGGAAAMHSATEEARKLGLALSDQDAVALHQLSHSLVISQERFRGLEMTIGKRILPYLVTFSELATKDADTWRIVWDNIVAVAAKAAQGILIAFSYLPGAIGRDFQKAAQNAKNWADQMGMDALLRAQHRDSILQALDKLNKSTFVPKISPAGKVGGIAGAKDAEKEMQEFLKARIHMADRLNDIAARESEKTSLRQITSGIQKLSDEARDAGANVLGLGIDFQTSFKQIEDAAAGMGGPLGGLFAKGGKTIPLFESAQMTHLRDQAKKLGTEMSQSFTRMIETGQGFKQMLGDLLRQFETFILKATIFKALGSSLSGSGGIGGLIGGFFSGLATPGRASGGPVTAGSMYMVGEEGPELFAPGMSGSIIPGGMSGRGGDTINIDARGAAPGVEHRIMRVLAAMQKRSTSQSLAAMHEYQARGGSL